MTGDLRTVLPAKLSLLRAALAVYELPHSPSDFLLTVAACGQWHPVAQVAHYTNTYTASLYIGCVSLCPVS